MRLAPDAAEDGPVALRAGISRSDITPPLGSPAGLALRSVVNDIWDPLTATVVVLESDGTRVALVGLDLMGVLAATHARIREAVSAATGVPSDRVVVNASHTHSAPYLSDELQELLRPLGLRLMDDAHVELVVERTAEAAGAAVAGMAAVTAIRTGRGHVERVAANRRPRTADGRVVHRYGRPPADLRELPEGLIDPEVAVIVLEGGARLIATIVVYACHPTAAGGGSHTHVTADLVGVGRGIVESRFGGSSLFLQGCAGDQGTGKWIADTPAADTRAMGARLATGVDQAMASLTDRPVARIGVATERLALELDPFPPLPVLERQLRAAAEGEDPGPIVALGDALVVARRVGELRTARLTAISLGDVALAVLPGEAFVEHGLSIRAGSPFPETVVAAYDDNTMQYIPTRAAFADGEYEVDGGWRYIRPGEGERMVAAMIGLLTRLRTSAA
jgi:hypothetical protein